MIVQNVFVDTHDPRYPWITFFTSRSVSIINAKSIRTGNAENNHNPIFLTHCYLYRSVLAGEELTWDYGYNIGSVDGRVVLCKCGETLCRGRLL